MNLIDLPLRNLLAEFSSSNPTPGGGSASALASAIGASLLTMVAGLPKTRTGADEERAALAAAADALGVIRQQLSDAIDADAAAYDMVVAAYKLPKASPEEQTARKAAIQLALRGATEVPLGVMRSSASALSHAKTVAANGNRNAASDIGVAAALLRAGLRGAGLNVAINLGSISDPNYLSAVNAETVQLSAAAAKAAGEAEALVSIG